MARRCTICRHPQRTEIDRAIVEHSGTLRELVKRYGVSLGALSRHKAEHLPRELAKAKEAMEAAGADTLLEQIEALKGRAERILSKAEKKPKTWYVALGAIREMRQTLELLARITGELDERMQVNILASPQWLAIQGVIVAALVPFPEAAAAVAGRLEKLEDRNDSKKFG